MRKFLFGLSALALVATSASAQDPGPAAPVQYDVAFPNAAHREAKITATFRKVPKGALKLRMSRSSPGRYAIHEFAKNVYQVTAVDGAGKPLSIERTDPYGWAVSGHDGTVKVTYTLYADRGDGTYSQVDKTHAHLNMPATFLWAAGYDDKPIRVRFERADPSWKIATQLPPVTGQPDSFWAPNLQYFMDSPTELSAMTVREWTVTDKGRDYTFRLALHDPGTLEDADLFAAKLKAIVPEHIKVFGELPKFDYGEYTFIADYMPQITGDGMEHRNSTFISQPRSLFRGNFSQLGTASHELFHAWNVERIRPAELEPFDFTKANPTPSLWLAEGFTQYYGPLLIRRAGQSTTDEFLAGLEGRSYAFAVLAVNIANVIPTGIPWLSTITGVPMLYLLAQYFAGRPVPSLPRAIGRRGLPRGKLQDFLDKARRFIRWLENTVHARREGWVNGTPRRAMQFAWAANVLILALPIPFDNLFPAWAILFFCFALIEDDGVMAILGWIMTVITAFWTVFLLMVGHAAISAAISTLRAVMFD